MGQDERKMTIQVKAIQPDAYQPNQAGVIRRRKPSKASKQLQKASHFELVTDSDGLILQIAGTLPRALGTPEQLKGTALASLLPVDDLAGHERRRRHITQHPAFAFRSVLPMVTSKLSYLACSFFVQEGRVHIHCSDVTDVVTQALVLADPGELMRVTMGDHDVSFNHVAREVDDCRERNQGVILLYLRSPEEELSVLETTQRVHDVYPGAAVYPARRNALWIVLAGIDNETANRLFQVIADNLPQARTGIAPLHPITQSGRELMLAAALAWAAVPSGQVAQLFRWQAPR